MMSHRMTARTASVLGPRIHTNTTITKRIIGSSGGILGNNEFVSSSQSYGGHIHMPQAQQKRSFVKRAVYRWAKRQMPTISKTEQIALGCGTIGTCPVEKHYQMDFWT